jgi:hypothetical protein
MVRRVPHQWVAVLLIAISGTLLACGDESAESDGIVDVSVGEILADPGDFDLVRVDGIGSPLGSAGFVLDGDGATVLVGASHLPALRVDDGDQLVVVGQVGELERHQIDGIYDEARRGGGERGTIDAEALAALSPKPGDPYIRLLNVRGEGGNG